MLQRRHRVRSILWVAIALLALSIPAAAEPPDRPHPPGAGPDEGSRGPDGRPRRPGGGPGERMSENRLESLVEELGLEEAKLEQVDEILDASRTRGREIRRELRQAHERMRGLLEASAPDEGAIFAQVDVISSLQGDQEKNRLGTLIRVRALLSEDERGRLLDKMKRRPPPPRRRDGPPPRDRPW